MKTKKHKLDNDTIRKLSGLFPSNNSYSVRITPDLYKDIEDKYKPVFVLSPLNNKELKDLSKKFNSDKDVSEEQALDIMKKHIVDIENLMDISTGEVVEYSEDVFDSIPTVVQSSLINELMKISGIKV